MQQHWIEPTALGAAQPHGMLQAPQAETSYGPFPARIPQPLHSGGLGLYGYLAIVGAVAAGVGVIYYFGRKHGGAAVEDEFAKKLGKRELRRVTENPDLDDDDDGEEILEEILEEGE